MTGSTTGKAMHMNSGGMFTGDRAGAALRAISGAIGFCVLALITLSPSTSRAQQITVGFATCSGAYLQFTSEGNFPVVPAECGGNGNPCPSATYTISSGYISVNAPPSCVNATVPVSQNPQRTVLVNGHNCNAAIGNWTGQRLFLYTPLSCITGVPVPPSIEQYVELDTAFCSGLTVDLFQSQTSFTIPGTCPIVGHAAPKLNGARSVKAHGVNTFFLPIDTSKAITADVTVEPRRANVQGHLIYIQFDTAITTPGIATVVDSSGAPVSFTLSYLGDTAYISLLNVPDNRRVSVSLRGTNGSANTTVSLGFLVGDVNGSRTIDAFDVLAVKSRTGQITTSQNFMYDLKGSGSINAADLATVKARQGMTLAP